jgi:hypothetical protein
MSDFDPSRTSLSLSSDTAAKLADPDGTHYLAKLLDRALEHCQNPSDWSTFLPRLLRVSPIQPYHVDRWKFTGLGSHIDGSDSVCAADTPSNVEEGMGEHDPDGNILIELEEVYVDGLANVKPSSWDVTPGDPDVHAEIDFAFSAFDSDALPEGVSPNLVIKAAFHIRQPCVSIVGDKSWTATGHGTLTITIKASTGHTSMSLHTTGPPGEKKLHADVSSLSFDVAGLNSSQHEPSENGSDTRALDEEAYNDEAAESDPQVHVDIHVDDLTSPDRNRWHKYITNVVNSSHMLRFFQNQINDVLARKDTRTFFASVFVHQMMVLLSNEA